MPVAHDLLALAAIAPPPLLVPPDPRFVAFHHVPACDTPLARMAVVQHGRSTTGGRQPARSRSGIVDQRPAIRRRPADEGGAIMGKHAGSTGAGASSRSVPTSRAPAPAVRPSRARRWALAGLIGLAIAWDVGLFVAAGARLRGARDASRAAAAARDAAIALRGPVPARSDLRAAPWIPGHRGRRGTTGSLRRPGRRKLPVGGRTRRSRRPGASMLPEARPGPDRSAAGAADPPAGMAARWGGTLRPDVAARRPPLPRRRRPGAGL